VFFFTDIKQTQVWYQVANKPMLKVIIESSTSACVYIRLF
jgi:hypothetical protein